MSSWIPTRSGTRSTQKGVNMATFVLPTMLGEIDALAKAEGKTRSQVIRDLIAEALRLREYERALVEHYEQEQRQLSDAA